MPRNKSIARPLGDRQQVQEWRERIPELREIVEVVAPGLWNLGTEERKKLLPPEWLTVVARMREDVQEAAAAATEHSPALSLEQRLGYHWSRRLEKVTHMLEHLMQVVREDIALPAGATLASFALLEKAMLHVQRELENGGTENGRDDNLETRHRVLLALKHLSPYFDDPQMRRLRALQVMNWAPRLMRVRSKGEIEDSLASLVASGDLDLQDVERDRTFMMSQQPVMMALMVRQSLTEVDERFAQLDPLVVLEECAASTTAGEGGRTDEGEGRTGPARALARLAVTCGALGFAQRENEDFDAATERARNSLLVSKSRIKDVIEKFPLGSSEAALTL